MAFCANCGASVNEGAHFCAQCGQQAGAPVAGASVPPRASADGIPSNVAGGLCYVFWFLSGVVFLVLEPYDRDPYVRFHAFQSIFFTLAAIVISTVVGMVPFVGLFLWYPVWLGLMVLWVVLLVQAFSGKKWKLPMIGDWAERQSQSKA